MDRKEEELTMPRTYFSRHHKKAPHKGPWQIQEAKAHFSELIDTVLEKGMQTISRHGEEIALIISHKEFDRLLQPKESLLDFFKKAPCQDVDLDLQRKK